VHGGRRGVDGEAFHAGPREQGPFHAFAG
jgi:hypothetical protein